MWNGQLNYRCRWSLGKNTEDLFRFPFLHPTTPPPPPQYVMLLTVRMHALLYDKALNKNMARVGGGGGGGGWVQIICSQ